MARRARFWGVVHAVFFVVVVSSIFWLRWRWLLLVFAILRVQDAVFGGCILAKWEYGSLERRYTKGRIGHLLPRRRVRSLRILID